MGRHVIVVRGQTNHHEGIQLLDEGPEFLSATGFEWSELSVKFHHIDHIYSYLSTNQYP